MVLVIFDIDGTLVYSNKIDSLCFAQTYEQIYQRPFPTIDWRAYPHVTDTTIFGTVIQKHFGRSPKQEEVEYFQERFVTMIEAKRQTNPEEFKEVPGAKLLIEKLLTLDHFALGIATGGWHRPAQTKLQFVGIPYDQLLLSAADGKVTREAIINEVVNHPSHERITFDKVVYIGDAIWDVTTTRNLQMDFIGIRRQNDKHHLLEAGATIVLENYLDQHQFLDAIQIATPPRPL